MATTEKREDLPRISADTLQDWQRVKANYTNAIISRLDSQLAAKGLSKDRDTALMHINQYVDSVFSIAKPNLRVNGRNYEDLDGNDEEFEAFDEGLDRHIWSLSDQRLKWDREIGRTRTEKPREVEVMLRDLFDRQLEASLEDVESASDDKEVTEEDPLEVKYPQIEQVFLQASALSEELNQSIPVQQERSKRIKTVSKEVKALKS